MKRIQDLMSRNFQSMLHQMNLVTQLDSKATEEALKAIQIIEDWLKTKEFLSDECKKNVQLAVNYLKQRIASNTSSSARK